ncbi:MAG: hypothetical protein DMG12_09905, partial [Acidobacteria bacterium]
MLRSFVFSLVIVLSSFIVLAQETPQKLEKQDKDKDYTLSVVVEEVQLPISVLDKDGRPVNGLTKNDFAIFEDNVQQQIKVF